MTNTLKTDNITIVFQYFLNQIKANQTFKNEYLNKKIDFAAIAEDSRAVVLREVYGKMNKYNFNNLSIDYVNHTIMIINERVMKSGLQMAKLLNDIFKERARFCNIPAIFFLIVVLILYILKTVDKYKKFLI